MRCATLSTGGRLHDEPVRLAVRRLQAFPDKKLAHPVVFVPGGPGDAAGLKGAGLRAWRVFQQRAGWPRDLVLYDPRSTGASRPRIGCPPGVTDDDEPLAACFAAVGAETAGRLGLSAQVADLHRLIVALGEGPVTLWAQSFGAQIGFRLAARYPGDVRNIILDSPVLEAEPLGVRTRHAMQARFQALIAHCARLLPCAIRPIGAGALLRGWLDGVAHAPFLLSHAEIPYPAHRLRVDPTTLLTAWLLAGYGPDHDSAVLAALRHALTDRQRLWPTMAGVARLSAGTAMRTPVFWSSRCAVRMPVGPVQDPWLQPPAGLTGYLPRVLRPCDRLAGAGRAYAGPARGYVGCAGCRRA
ncbi:alpha/beta fold hydrolase [Salinisphaera sp. Q1T1-3]|uniref:alpha/beta fold hydrolase n=1 Tax=Salinisphaera sp. Q1T1-3 TaxID=2321229 RepID=UPI001314523A|nr:alpha/beta fold hydrolase [Salinisphaera sp. Q1T1-3]